MALNEPIDLLNVAFQQIEKDGSAAYHVPDRISGEEAVTELREACPCREWRFVEISISFAVSLRARAIHCHLSSYLLDHSQECQAHRERVLDLMYPASTEMDLVGRIGYRLSRG